MLRKLDVHDRVHAVIYASESGAIEAAMTDPCAASKTIFAD